MSGIVKYSVIIPAYNAEETIGRCLKSLIEQKRDDIEIIVINDGSTDATANIVQRFSEDNDCVICIHQKNGGVSSARNNGLNYASGTYITFVDSDDYVTANYFEKLDCMDDADLCYFLYRIVGGEQQGIDLFDLVNDCTEWVDRMKLLLVSRVIMNPVNKRFKRQIIENIGLRFIENLHISEDFNFCLSYSMQCTSISVYKDSIYWVDIANENSLSRKARANLTADINNSFQYIESTVRKSSQNEKVKDELLVVLDYLYVKNVCTCIAETFKYTKPRYIKNFAKYQEICKTFKKPIGDGKKYYSFVHHGLRFLLTHNFVFPFYIVAWTVKERRFKKYRGMCL